MSWLGVDVGGTKAQAVLVDDDLTVLATRRTESSAKLGAGRMMDTVLQLIRELLAEAGPAVRGVGVGAAGVIDPVSGTVAASTAMFPEWAGSSPAALLGEQLGRPVAVENDVNAFLRGEAAVGAARGERHAVGLTIGTGIGGALISDGVLLRGASGGAGEIGHTPGYGTELCTCGAYGHLESIASGPSIGRRYTARTGRSISTFKISVRARGGEAEALAVFAEAGAALGQAIATVATVLDSKIVVLGGGVIDAWDLIEPHCWKAVRASMLPTNADLRIEPAQLGQLAVAIGAAALAQSESA